MIQIFLIIYHPAYRICLLPTMLACLGTLPYPELIEWNKNTKRWIYIQTDRVTDSRSKADYVRNGKKGWSKHIQKTVDQISSPRNNITQVWISNAGLQWCGRRVDRGTEPASTPPFHKGWADDRSLFGGWNSNKHFNCKMEAKAEAVKASWKSTASTSTASIITDRQANKPTYGPTDEHTILRINLSAHGLIVSQNLKVCNTEKRIKFLSSGHRSLSTH